MSPRVSAWKSQGETRTMSPTRTQTLLFSFPLILQRRSRPSWHFTITRSKPSSLTAMPRTSLATGKGIFPKSSSLITFLLPNFPTTSEQRLLSRWMRFQLGKPCFSAVLFGGARLSRVVIRRGSVDCGFLGIGFLLAFHLARPRRLG